MHFVDIYRVTELEEALLDDCDLGTIREICQGRLMPKDLRAQIWQVRKSHVNINQTNWSGGRIIDW